MKAAKNDKEKLEQALKAGEDKAFYRRELGKMGWKITSVNYDKPDYVEYEIVKGDKSYEVQIDLDKNSHKATKVDVAYNAWQTDATENALQQRRRAGNRFSSRDAIEVRRGVSREWSTDPSFATPRFFGDQGA